MPTNPKQKGAFGPAALPLSARYLYPATRNRLLLIAGGVAALATAIMLVGTLGPHSRLLSSGPLTSAHASLETTCATCHSPAGQVTDAKCSVCHEKFTTGLGAHSFDAHYVYESGDSQRAFVRGNEQPCVACHIEHKGRTATMTAVGEDRCSRCHKFSFGSHPEFAFAAKSIPDDAGLAFTHVKHVERVMDRRHLDTVESSCLTCHTATSDGKHFEPTNFARDCSSCHLGRTVRSAELELRASSRDLVTIEGDSASLSLGVESLDAVRRRLGPGEQWALDMSPAQFETDGGFVIKVGIEHADPWIMHNLRLIRRALYPTDSVADLLRTSGTVRSGGNRKELYAEALSTLREYATGLRGQADPAIQGELVDIDRQISDLERQVAAPGATLSDSRFRSDLPTPAISADQLREIDEFAAQVARPCAVCHTVEHATIGRVQKNQQTLTRALFNHRAHVLQRDCLSCHTGIPVAANLGVKGPLDAAVDHASIQNLPRIGECQACHTPKLASDRCSMCHNFHPGKERFSRLAIH